MKSAIVLLCLFFTHSICHAQSESKALVDSLLKELPKFKDDTNKVNLLNEVANAFGSLYPDESIKYEQQQLALATELNYKPGIGKACFHLADDFATKRNFQLAFEYYYRSVSIFTQINAEGPLTHTYFNMATVFELEKKYDSALIYYYKTLSIFNRKENTSGTATILLKISFVDVLLANYSNALKNSYAALDIAKKFSAADYNRFAPAIEGVIGEAYLGIARNKDSLTKTRQQSRPASTLDSAIKYLQKAAIENEENKNTDNAIVFSRGLSDAYQLSGNYKKAYETLRHLRTLEDSAKSGSSREENGMREMVNEMKEAKINLKEKQIRTERKARILFIAGLCLLALLVVLILKNFRNQLKANKIISKEKKRSDDLLLNILPSEVAEELKEKGSASAKHFDHVTVLFTDFVGFTKAGERMSPQQLVDELDGCFKEFDRITSKYGIEKIKTIGDAYLAVGGLPIAIPNHAECAVSAAIEIRDFMQQRKKQLGDNTFEVRIGVHTGSVVAGIVGVRKFAYDIWGDTVNTAARIEQNSEAGKVNVSQTTYDLIKDKFDCTYRGEIDAKNKGEMSMYFVERFIRA